MAALFDEANFEIVERRELDRVLQEQQQYTQNVFDKETVAELQKLLGIDAIVTGSIIDLGETLQLNARAISVETGKIFGAAREQFDKDKVVENLLQQSAGVDKRLNPDWSISLATSASKMPSFMWCQPAW